MRQIKYLSPTSIATWLKDPTEYYLNYRAEDRPARFPQTQPMSIGSAFDAYVKSYLHAMLFGEGSDPRFSIEALFETQVEEHNRDWAWGHGQYVFDCYKNSGALADLGALLQKSVTPPRFEVSVEGPIGPTGLRLLGKPDLHFTILSAEGRQNVIVYDWKVSGYCSKSNTSPKPGYIMCRDGWRGDFAKHSRSHLQSHPSVIVESMAGCRELNYSKNILFEDIFEDWARQLAVYSWVLGVPVGEEPIVGIDLLACDGSKRDAPEGRPLLRVAEYRGRISAAYQTALLQIANNIWACHTELVDGRPYIFRNMSQDESVEYCRMLDTQAAALRGNGTEEDAIFAELSRGTSYGAPYTPSIR